MSSVLNLSITQISKLIRSKAISPSDLSALCLERINKIKNLNAFITITKERAVEQSEAAIKRLNEETPLSTLDGIPIAIKDNFSTQGIRTTCASKMLSEYIAPYNATVVEKLFDSGAVLMGKTNHDEFAMGSGSTYSYFGPTKNPWRSGLEYELSVKSKESQDVNNLNEKCGYNQVPLNDGDFFVAGGSSGGSAVAVATGACFGAISSDTGGSTRCPAAFCGVVGLKPTYGLVSRNGLIPLCNSLDVPGVITRTVDDSVAILNCIAGQDPKDSTMIPQDYKPFSLPESIDVSNLTIGIPKEYECPGLAANILETWKTVADAFENAGAKVIQVSLPHTKYSIRCYSVLSCCDIASNFARYDGIRYGHRSASDTTTEHHYAVTRHEGFGEIVRERILAGNYFLLKENYEKYFIQASKVRRLICNDFADVFQHVDMLLTPVTLTEPIPYSQWILTDERQHNAVDDFCTQPVNMAGLPAVSIPCSVSSNGLSLSLQLIGKSLGEQKMLTVAKWIEQQMDFPLLDLK